MVTLISSEWADGFWLVVASVSLPSGTRTGPHMIELGASATEAQVKAAILSLYQ